MAVCVRVCMCVCGGGGGGGMIGRVLVHSPRAHLVMLWESLVPKSSLLVCPFSYVGIISLSFTFCWSSGDY